MASRFTSHTSWTSSFFTCCGGTPGLLPSARFKTMQTSPPNRYTRQVLLPRIWELRHNWTAYDAAYIARAKELSAPLLTRDRGFASGSAPDTGRKFVWFSAPAAPPCHTGA